MANVPPPLDIAEEPEKLVGGSPSKLLGTIPTSEDYAGAFFPGFIGRDAARAKEVLTNFWSSIGVHKVQWTIKASALGPDKKSFNSGSSKVYCICGLCLKLIAEAGPVKEKGWHVTRIHHHVSGCPTRFGCNMPHTFGASTLRWPAKVLERGIFEAEISELKSQSVEERAANKVFLIDFSNNGDQRFYKELKDCRLSESDIGFYILRVLYYISHHLNMSKDVQDGLLFIHSASIIFGGTLPQHPHYDVYRYHQTQKEKEIWTSFRDAPGHHPPATIFVPFEAYRELHLLQSGMEESSMKIMAGTALYMRGDCPHGGVGYTDGELRCAGHFHLDSSRYIRMNNTISYFTPEMPKYDLSVFSAKELAENKAELKRQLSSIEEIENEQAAKKKVANELAAKKMQEEKEALEKVRLSYVGVGSRTRSRGVD
jgi:hypothetical protein